MPFPRITPKELLLGIFLILSWTWALWVSQERFQILEIGDWLRRFLIMMFSLTVILTFICVRTFEKPSPGGTKRKRWISLMLQRTLLTIVCFVVSCGAALGLLQTTNAVFDWKVNKVYQTKLIDTYIDKGKHTRYYIVVENVWEKPGGRYQISITRSRYLRGEFQIGKLLRVTVGEGALGFPWIKKIEQVNPGVRLQLSNS
jgi:hypothetical protein